MPHYANGELAKVGDIVGGTGMETRSTIIRNYAAGMADAFLNDLLLAEESGKDLPAAGENSLIDAFCEYVAEPQSIFAGALAKQ